MMYDSPTAEHPPAKPAPSPATSIVGTAVASATNQVATAAMIITPKKSRLPPCRSAHTPSTTRIREPDRNGTPRSNPNCVSERPYCRWISTPMIAKIVHTAKQPI